jgi:hypothetical protein
MASLTMTSSRAKDEVARTVKTFCGNETEDEMKMGQRANNLTIWQKQNPQRKEKKKTIKTFRSSCRARRCRANNLSIWQERNRRRSEGEKGRTENDLCLTPFVQNQDSEQGVEIMIMYRRGPARKDLSTTPKRT